MFQRVDQDDFIVYTQVKSDLARHAVPHMRQAVEKNDEIYTEDEQEKPVVYGEIVLKRGGV